LKFIFLSFIILISLGSCKQKSGCTEFEADNYDPDAVLNNGLCIAVSDKFIGNFSVSSDCFTNDYTRKITATSNNRVVIISNLNDTLGTVSALVTEINITIERQTVGTFITIEGAGVFLEENKAVSLTYRVRDSRTGTELISDCKELCTKQ